jgi:HD-GYP domain-containing protein (c-di-GMP phosphodiesterase class II)
MLPGCLTPEHGLWNVGNFLFHPAEIPDRLVTKINVILRCYAYNTGFDAGVDVFRIILNDNGRQTEWRQVQIDLSQMIFALSETLDLVGVDDVQHGKRVGYMAWVCAKAMGLNYESQKKIFNIGLLHDCGVSSTRVHKNLIDEMNWTGAQIHCDIGADRLRSCRLISYMADPVFYHHTHWQDLKNIDLPEETRRFANLLFLVDRVDSLVAPRLEGEVLQSKDGIRKQILQHAHTYFDPELVDVFMTVSDSEAFWITLEPLHLICFLQEREKDQEIVHLSPGELRQLADIFARVVDAKSPFTFRHSAGVALLSRYLADDMGLPGDICFQIETAGLLHDLGKLKVPDEILEKSGPLNSVDLARMQHHSYESYIILNRIKGMENIALWAGNHHEALNGQGYPFHRTAEDLCIQSRLIAVADVFQAFSQNRPYRNAMPLEDILKTLGKLVAKGHLDPDVVSRVMCHPDDSYMAATLNEDKSEFNHP